jgi:hypothetical protein
VKLGCAPYPLNPAAITLNRDLRTNSGQASRPVVRIIDRRHRLYAIRRHTIVFGPSPFLQCPVAVVSLLAPTMALTSVQAPATLIVAASAGV